MNTYALDVGRDDTESLRKVALTSLRGKCQCTGRELDHLANICINAGRLIANLEPGTRQVEGDTESLKIVKRPGGSIADTRLVYGIVLDRIHTYPGMPEHVSEARIALVNKAIVFRKPRLDFEVELKTVSDERSLKLEEERTVREPIEGLRAIGVNVLICGQWIDDIAQHYLSKYGIFTVREVSDRDLIRLSKATGAKLVSLISDVSESDLGSAGLVERKKLAGEFLVWITGCSSPRSVTILLRGGSERLLDELERFLKIAVKNVISTLKEGKIISDGGAIEMEIAARLREYALTIGGYEQLAIDAFAKAMESIPRSLLENAGFDPMDTLIRLRWAHRKGKKYASIDLDSERMMDMRAAGVFVPLQVSRSALQIATELAKTILCVDEQITISAEHERVKRRRIEEEREAFRRLEEKEEKERREMEELGDYEYVRKHARERGL
jgi:chaperonin GroEL (HSP60 family)